MKHHLQDLFQLIEFSDSTFPVGTFSFSNSLESAAANGIVKDSESLRFYIESVVLQSVYTDGIAGLQAHRSYGMHYYEGVLHADEQVMLCKMNAEARLMTQRMGKKLAELSMRLFSDAMLSEWLADIRQGKTPGSYPVAQAVLFASCGLSEEELFCSQQYGVINMVLSAALRCVRVSHYDTQRILFSMRGFLDKEYEQIKQLDYEDMYAFVPEMDVLASLHEKGIQRMFMN